METEYRKYAIIDVETTGSSAHRDRLTEIAIAVHDGYQVIDSYESLINPEVSIPLFIQNLTGITNEMVEEAPYFYEIAKKIVEMTEDCIFVAHNVKFDYMFIRNEFERLGYSYQKRQLCTRQLSKKIFPEIGKYSLDRLIDYFNIHTEIRHRAMADVQATIEVFEHLIHSDKNRNLFTSEINRGIQLSKLPDSITIEDIHQIPEKSGIYYFFGENDHLLYIGKSKNIQKRIMQHFSNPTSKSRKFLERTRRIDYEVTGSEITALILEDAMIKRKKPEYNITQRMTEKPFGLSLVPQASGMWYHLALSPLTDQTEEEMVKTYKSKRSAQMHLLTLLQDYNLDTLLEIEKKREHIHTRLRENPEQNPELWTENFSRLIRHLKEREGFHHLIIDSTYSHHEASCFLFDHGRLARMGKLDITNGFTSIRPNDLDDCRIPLTINDQVITFIENRKSRYIFHPLSENFDA